MKAQAFLELVGEMLTAQQDYFHARRKSDGPAANIYLFKAKDLEKQARAVVKEGRLEPDVEPGGPAATTIAGAEEERQLRLHLEDERDAGEPERDLDLSEE